MTRIRSFARIATVALAIAVIAAPGFAAVGSANFKTVVAIGDSYGAGFESNSLNEHHSVYSWPAIVAKQLGIPLCTLGSSATDNCFAQPIVSYPGIGPEMTLMDISTYPPVIVNAPGSGAPLNTTFGRAFNNVSIPGANVADTFTVTGTDEPVTRGVQQLAQFILRGPVTEVDAVIVAASDLHPGLDRRQRLPRLGHERHDRRPDAAGRRSPRRTTRCWTSSSPPAPASSSARCRRIRPRCRSSRPFRQS